MKAGTGLIIFGVICMGAALAWSIIDTNQNYDIIPVDSPSYSQGFYDGMNATIKYLDETDQLKDSTKLELTWFIDEENKMEQLRIKE